VAVKIKLKRIGKIHAPQYRIVVADSRTARNGRAIEEIGIYQPLDNPSLIKLDSERVQYWLGVGAQPTEAVTAILKVTGDWQKFKGLPGAEGTLEVAPPKPNKLVAYEEAVKAAASEPKSKPKPKLATEAPATEAPAAEAPAAEAPATEAPVADAVTEEIAAADETVAETQAEETTAESAAADEVAAEAIEQAADEAAAEAAAEDNA